MTEKMIKSMQQLWARETFFAEVLSECRFIKTRSIPTAGVNITKEGMNFYYNVDFMESLSIKQMNYVMIHEVCHLLSNHMERGKLAKHDFQASNIAADMIINSNINEFEGFNKYLKEPTNDMLVVPKEYSGDRILEPLYKWLQQHPEKAGYWGSFFDVHLENEISEEEAKMLRDEIVKRGKQRGTIKGDFEALIHELTRPQDNPIKRLKGAIAEQIKQMKEKTWAKPSLIRVGKGFKRRSNEITVLLDTSGSMEGAFDKVLSYIFLKELSVNLIQCDVEVRDTTRVTNLTQLKRLKIKGLGGTTLMPGVLFAKKRYPNTPFVVMTDGFTDTLDFTGFKKEVLVLTTESTNREYIGNYKEFVIRNI